MRNPPWSRDELILTLDFYHRYAPKLPDKSSNEVRELSGLLNMLQQKMGVSGDEKFRNANGVSMKLMNFHRFNPNYSGKGLERGGKGDEVVWNLFSSNLDELKKVADTIRSHILADAPFPQLAEKFTDEEESEEGKVLTRVHRYRERNTKIIKRKKEKVLSETGSLNCEVCTFEFGKVYGNHGDGFIECHHTKPVSEMNVGEKTKLADLALVCPNCHRMIHRTRPWLSIEELKAILAT